MGDGTTKDIPGRGNHVKREKQDKREGTFGRSEQDRLPTSYRAQMGHLQLEPA